MNLIYVNFGYLNNGLFKKGKHTLLKFLSPNLPHSTCGFVSGESWPTHCSEQLTCALPNVDQTVRFLKVGAKYHTPLDTPKCIAQPSAHKRPH